MHAPTSICFESATSLPCISKLVLAKETAICWAMTLANFCWTCYDCHQEVRNRSWPGPEVYAWGSEAKGRTAIKLFFPPDHVYSAACRNPFPFVLQSHWQASLAKRRSWPRTVLLHALECADRSLIQRSSKHSCFEHALEHHYKCDLQRHKSSAHIRIFLWIQRVTILALSPMKWWTSCPKNLCASSPKILVNLETWKSFSLKIPEKI